MKHNRQALIVKSSAVRFGRTVSSISLSRKPLPQCPEPAGLDVTPRPFSDHKRMKAIVLAFLRFNSASARWIESAARGALSASFSCATG
jgi:hypothetical protein